MGRTPAVAVVFFLVAVTSLSFGQTASSPAGQQKSSKDDVVRISVTLVQVDAVVTDKHGRQVTDLKPEDFEIREDGRPQQITHFGYVSTGPAPGRPAPGGPAPPAADKDAPPIGPPRLKPDQVRRTVALVVDDLTLSFESVYSIRLALKKFVDEQMQPGDLVAIIRTGGGIGVLQQFTSDKRQLYASIERVRWNPAGLGGIGAFAPIERDPMGAAQRNARAGPEAASAAELDLSYKDRYRLTNELNDFREQIFTIGTLGALRFVVQGLATLPGRKSVILLSDGISIYFDQDRDTRVLDPLRRLADLANRASVVIYTIDARGLQILGLTALFESQQGLAYLAEETGGLALANTNDLGRAVARVLDDQSGYYLIGYIPDESTFKPVRGLRPFHKISVRVKRAGLRVRSRKGFLGITDEEAALVPRTRSQQLYSAITSPFGAEDISLRLTSIFGNGEKSGSYVFSMLHIDPSHFTFVEDEPGSRKAVFDVLAMAFGDNGVVLSQINRTETIRVRNDHMRDLLVSGFALGFAVPVKKPGAYQVRVAVRDVASEKLGSASQFVEVPDVRKGRLVVSDILLLGRNLKQAADRGSAGGAGDTGARTQPAGGQAEAANTGASDQRTGQQALQASDEHPAVRRFRPGAELDLSFIVHNAKIDKKLRQPNLEMQMRIFKEGKVVYTGPQAAFDARQRTDYSRIGAGGTFRLNKDMEPGQYSLQVVCTDRLSKPDRRTATQWIDFEVAK